MLNAQDLLDKMKLHFPKWMDIRKRVAKSNGGHLLLSVAEETAVIQDAIDEYKKDFFLKGYLGREDSIVAFVYKLHIGNVNIDTVTINKPELDITEDLNEFYSNHGLTYYENGYLYFRVEDINPTLKIEYSIDNFTTSNFTEKMHVWNIFDEFAVFVGMERHINETNLQLEQRILNASRRPTNSTDTGLKNAILNEMMILDPTLVEDDINISKPTPENLVKYYKEFGSVIEKLAHVNRDIYRTKRWDLDTWNYAFKSIDYVPHAWDIAIDAYQNGVGFKDDLEVTLTTPEDTTNATVSFYSESSLKIQEYVKKKDITTDIDLKLTKYDDVLNPVIAKYKITASEAKDITAEPIMIESSEIINGVENRYVQDIAANDMQDITMVDNATISADKNYKLIFSPKNSYGTMIIEDCNLVTTQNSVTTTTSLLSENSNFGLNADGSLYYKNVKAYITQRMQLLNYTNIVNALNGMSIDDLSLAASMTIDAAGMQNQYFSMQYDCATSLLPNSYISKVGFTVNSLGNIATVSSASEKYVEINAVANQISFNMLEGNYTIEITTPDGTETLIKNGAYNYISSLQMNPIAYKIKITPIGTSAVSLTNVRYSKFNITLSLETGEFASVNGKMVLPQDISNKVYINMTTYTGYSPVVKFIYIGPDLTSTKYETAIIAALAGSIRRLAIKTNCNVSLVEVDGIGNAVAGGTINNYEPYYSYKATSDQAYVKLDVSAYSQIDSIAATSGRFESIGTGDNKSLYMRLRKDEVAFKVTITGQRLIEAKSISLAEALGINVGAGDLIYADSLLKAFVVVKDGVQQLATLTPSLVNNNAESYSITGVPNDIGCAFVINSDENSTVISNSRTGRFEWLYMFPRKSQTYIAYNEYKMFSQEAKGIDIVDVFNPFLPTNAMMVYQVESMDTTGTTNVKFDQTGVAFASLDNWSAGRKDLRIISNINMTSIENYSINAMEVNEEFNLGETISLNKTYILPTGEIVELAKYIIEVPEGMTVEYNTKAPEDDIITAPEYYCSETISKEEDGFNKLSYSNIDEIVYIGTTPWNLDNPELNSPVSEANYTVLNQEGIIIWNGDGVVDGQIIYAVYTLKIPSYIQIDLKSIYKLIEYDMDAYTEIGAITIPNKGNGDTYDLKTISYYPNSERLTINCDEAGFETKIENGIIIFSRSSQSNVVAVKTGYYYVDGKEYYLFANESSDTVENYTNVEFYNADRDTDEIILNKRARNFVKNSYMEVKDNTADIYSMDFEKENNVYGISKLNAITACDSFNHWKTFGAELYLINGYNGVGIKIEPTLTNGYAFIDITNYLLDYSYVSFYVQGDLKAYIAEEMKFNGLSFGRSMIANPSIELASSVVETNMLEARFTAKPGYKYYLVLKGSGLIDDIIVQEGNIDVSNSLHIKNINILGFDITEKITNGFINRLYFDSSRNGDFEGTDVDSTGKIITSSMVDWGLTKIKTFDEQQSWKRCITSHVSLVDGVAQTQSGTPGQIETEPIYIGDKRAIKNLVFEINDVLFDNMEGFTTKIYTSDKMLTEYKSVSIYKDNLGNISGNFLSNYIKLIIEMPGSKIINNINIYIEYKSSQDAAPKESPMFSGTYTSEVLDTHYTAKYKLQGISIESISNINNVSIQVRGAKENYVGEVWTPWKDVKLNTDLNVSEDIIFDGYRFFQAKIVLKTKDTYIKLQHIDLEVV